MLQKITRTSLLISIILFSIFLVGSIFLTNTTLLLKANHNDAKENMNNIHNSEVIILYEYRVEDACCDHTDSTPPLLTLISPEQYSINLGGTIISIKITDDNFMYEMLQILYSWDTASSNSSLEVHDLESEIDIYEFTLPETNGLHTLYLYAEDYSNNWVSGVFIFRVGIPPPIVTLNYPTNNSIILGGSTIDFSIEDPNALISQVLYNWDNALVNETLDAPYDITLPADDSIHDLRLYAENDAGSWANVFYRFTATSNSSEVSIAPTSTTTTSSPPARRTPGFLLSTFLITLTITLCLYQKRLRKNQRSNLRK